MAKSTAGTKKPNSIDLENVSKRDIDILTLGAKEVMKKYKIEKQGVYDRRFALNKKLKEAGKTVEELTGSTLSDDFASNEPTPTVKRQPKKRGPKKRAASPKPQPATEPLSESRDLMVVSKQVPVIMKPIEINFDNFSVKLNGMPKKISVNPDTNSIEIDL